MRNLFFVAVVSLIPMQAHAGWTLGASLGKGFTDGGDASPLNIRVSPGYGFADLLRVELGLVADLPDVEDKDFDLQVYPSLVVAPPLLPVYGRLLVGVTDLLENNSDAQITYGGALGLAFGAGVTVFAEAGILPVATDVVIFEFRAGVGFY